MKKFILPILLLFMFIPFVVNAESGYLYDVLKDEAESNGLAKEYTGEHHDSFTEEPSKKIYHWYAENDTEGNQVLEKNNVIFANHCWQMIRTTDTGGVKIIYNGVQSNGQCNNTGANQQIGTSKFNTYTNSPAYVGYMYNTKYTYDEKSYSSETMLLNRTLSNSYWYADSVTWNSTTNKYELNNPYKVSNPNDYPNLVGKYTFYLTKQSYTGEIVRYITAVNNTTSYFINLKSGNTLEDINDNYTYGESYTNNVNGTYTINSPITINKSEYYSNINNMKNKYICKNATNNTCDEIWHATNIINESNIYYYKSTDVYKFADGYNYNNGTYTLNNNVEFWDILNSSNKTSLNNHHYTCFNTTGECSTLSYVYSYNNGKLYYINLKDGKGVEDALREMLSNDDINQTNSDIKTYIDSWYQNNMTSYSYMLEDIIFCNNRSIKELGGWNPNGGDVTTYLYFKEHNEDANDLSCDNITDRFCMTNTKAQLTYPVGLMRRNEMNLLGNNNLIKSNMDYWLESPHFFDNVYAYEHVALYSGNLSNYNVFSTKGVRPSISLKPGIKYSTGDGSKNNPYIIAQNHSINVEINNETEDLSIEIDDLTQVTEGEEVNFKITPIKGRKLTNIKIIDEDNNEIEYTTVDNKNYTFIMPSSDVTIIPSYERVKSTINVEDNKNTKEIVIEVNDATAVVYEDTVRFKLQPEEGYEVEDIDIIDEEQNKISYRKTSNINEYEFTMPDTNVIIRPIYRKKESINVSNTMKNPNTGTKAFIIIYIIVLVVILRLYFIIKRKKTIF